MLEQIEMKILKDSIEFDLMDHTTKTVNHTITSYGLKAIFERLLGFYISNEDFKQAMQEVGFESYGTGENVFYKLDRKHIQILNMISHLIENGVWELFRD